MKNIFKFAAVATAALAMLVSCEMLQVDKGTNTEEEKASLTIDGKQWICTYDDSDASMPCILDFGVTKTGKMLVGLQNEEGKWEAEERICSATYTIEMTSETSGVITYVFDHHLSITGDEEMATEKLCFSDLTENSVKFSAHEDCPTPSLSLVWEEAASVPADKITIEILPFEDEDKVSATIDGKQWICTYEGYTGNIPCVLDFGATKTGRMLVGVQEEDGSWVEDGMICDASYTIEKTSETSGVITYVSDYLVSLFGDEEMATEKLCYSELTENSVKFSAHEDYPGAFLTIVYEKAATVSADKITIEVLPVGGEDQSSVSIDGKQWSVTFMYGGMMEATLILDLGVTTENMATIFVGGDAFGGIYPMGGGNYTITSTDATSGKIGIIDPNDPTGAELVFNYSDLTESSVKLTCAAEAFAMENAEATSIEYTPEPME